MCFDRKMTYVCTYKHMRVCVVSIYPLFAMPLCLETSWHHALICGLLFGRCVCAWLALWVNNKIWLPVLKASDFYKNNKKIIKTTTIIIIIIVINKCFTFVSIRGVWSEKLTRWFKCDPGHPTVEFFRSSGECKIRKILDDHLKLSFRVLIATTYNTIFGIFCYFFHILVNLTIQS